MKNSSTTNRYSDAIFDIAKEDNELDSWKLFLEDLSEVFSDSKIVEFFQDPKISNKNKLELIINSEIKTNTRQLNFLRLVIEKGNAFLIDSILNRFNKLKSILTTTNCVIDKFRINSLDIIAIAPFFIASLIYIFLNFVFFSITKTEDLETLAELV